MSPAVPVLIASSALAVAWLTQQRALEGTGLALADYGIEPPALPEFEFAPIAAAIQDAVGLGPSYGEVNAMTQDTNVAAFLATIRAAEGTAGPNGYRTLYGYRLFDTFGDHPRIALQSPYGWTSAAGAYQIMARSPIPGSTKYTTVDTWGDVVRALNLLDFSPASQDAAAVWLVRRRGALADVQAGRFDAAIGKCAREWASLPGSPYGQPVRTLAQVRDVYANAGGAFA